MQWDIKSESGSIAPIFALSITAIIGVIATAVALAMDSKAANEIQYTADSAAIAGATAFATLETPKADERLRQALQAAEDYAVANSSYTLVEIDLDAVVEDSYGQQTSIDVELEFQPANIMARVAGRSGNASVRRRATAEAVWGFPLCALSLSGSGSGFSTEGSAHFSAKNCIAWSNSTSSNSIDLRGGKLEAKQICSAGNVAGVSRASPTPEEECDPIPNPLENWSPPAAGACQDAGILAVEKLDRIMQFYGSLGLMNISKAGYSTDDQASLLAGAMSLTADRIAEGSSLIDSSGRYVFGSIEGLTLIELLQIAGYLDNVNPADYAGDPYVDTPTITLSPGTYCGLDIAYGHVRMEPGVYHIKDSPLTVRRKATLTGDGVTIVLVGDDVAFGVLDSARLNLTAPVDGDTAGFALIEDASAPLKKSKPLRSRLTGDGTINAEGTIYLPRQLFSITGNGAGQQASPLLQIVAHMIEMKDTGALRIDFDPSQTKVPVGIKPARFARLVN